MRILLTNPTYLLNEILSSEKHFNKYVGWLNTPRYFGNFKRYTDYDPSMPICIDNSAFTNFESDKFQRLIDKIDTPIAWIAVPDVVGDARLTRILFNFWQPELHEFPLAFVAQDGCRLSDPPWHLIKCLFIGGTTRFKLSNQAARLIKEAKRRGKLIHMGRVNSNKRLRYAYSLGCDSVDGTGYQRFSKYRLKKALFYMDKLHRQQLIRI